MARTVGLVGVKYSPTWVAFHLTQIVINLLQSAEGVSPGVQARTSDDYK